MKKKIHSKDMDNFCICQECLEKLGVSTPPLKGKPNITEKGREKKK